MKFFKKHKLLSFAVISFITLLGVNFYMIFELVRIIRKMVGQKGPGLLWASAQKRPGPFWAFLHKISLEVSL